LKLKKIKNEKENKENYMIEEDIKEKEVEKK